jgi:citrate lyase beta subunit
VTRLGFGAASFAAGTGIEDHQSGLMVARSLLVLASSAQMLAGPIDSSPIELNDLACVTREAEAGRRLGFTGKSCTNPRQVLPVAFGFGSARR